MNNKLIVITGQTATGKTHLALQLAKKHNGELVNADSRQLYKKLDIITGKDLPALAASKIPYHLFDIVDPKQEWSSYDYAEAATPILDNITRRGRTPIIVGGSYLYIKHLIYGFDVNVPPNKELRKVLEKKSLDELQQILSPRPAKINDSDWKNPRRLIRRIEIAKLGESTGQRVDRPLRPSDSTTFIGLKHQDRLSLEQAIKNRVESRLHDGAIEEVKYLLKDGYTEHDPGLMTIGYQQIIRFLKGEYSQERAITEWTNREAQYAKRQIAFMKKDEYVKWQVV